MHRQTTVEAVVRQPIIVEWEQWNKLIIVVVVQVTNTPSTDNTQPTKQPSTDNRGGAANNNTGL